MSINRREMLILTGVAAVGACLGRCTLALGADLSTPPASLDVGTLSDFPADGISDKFAKSDGIMVVRKGDHIYATTAICTHRKNTLKVVNGELRCPAHGSRFNSDGEASKGPATSPLIRYGISKTADGHILVDGTKTFDKEKWSDPASFVQVK